MSDIVKQTYRQTFKNSHTFLAVVHVEDYFQALRNARVAQDNGADGIFLINHDVPSDYLFDCYKKIKKGIPDFWIGLNCLDLGMTALGVIPQTTSGLWVDNSGVQDGDTSSAEMFDDGRRESGWQGLYFGGVAFKGQARVQHLEEVTLSALPFMDVITTSGKGTGVAAEVSKVQRMKSVMMKHPLAVASGITPENVSEYMPHVDCFLVATGVSDSHTELNPLRVRALAERIKG
jgi:uncharacterized protein